MVVFGHNQGNPSSFFEECQITSQLVQLKVASNGAVSFEMIEPAMQAVYDLPTRD